jgi:polyadenylation factor subunit 2
MVAHAPKAGSSRGPDTWHPSKYLEPLHPDNEEVLEQAAYQAAVTRLGGDNRARRYKPRKTVDWQGGVIKWRQVRRRGQTESKGEGAN